MSFYNKPGSGPRFLSWFGFIMVVAYIGLGIFVLSGNYYLKDMLTPKWRYGVGTLFVAYGLFRAIRLYKNIISIKDNESEEEK